MWVYEMKLFEQFNPKIFVMVILVCAAIAGIAAWVTGLSFWILGAIIVGAVLVNGLVATFVESDSSRDQGE